MYGPTLDVSKEIHATKYRQPGESFEEAIERLHTGFTNQEWTTPQRERLMEALLEMRFVPAGRVQAAVGNLSRKVTPFNCFVSGIIPDSMEGIMRKAWEAAETMRRGGGIGYDFSTIRPRGATIVSLNSKASGAVSFMGIFDAVCATVASAGNRRGAQIGVLRCDHPDIEEFISAKQNDYQLKNFNISVGITDKFMFAVMEDKPWALKFGGRVYRKVAARDLFSKIMESTWNWAEPGVIFLDQINSENNLWYCENICTCNPCSEQSLPAYGACLLGSMNLVKYVIDGEHSFNYSTLAADVDVAVRALDSVIDDAYYPLPEQQQEAQAKRRMGIGVMGLANAGECVAGPYGSEAFLAFTGKVAETIRNQAYATSIELAEHKGPFPMFKRDAYCMSKFINRLPTELQADIRKYGIHNSHLTSIAPTGTISLCADNVSSGCEPVFSHEIERQIVMEDGVRTTVVPDYAYARWGVAGKTADKLAVADHLNVLRMMQPYVDSAISKTCNVGNDVTFEQFKDIYINAWKSGLKGVTTFRAAGLRFGIMKKAGEGAACYVNPKTGEKECA